MKESDNKSDNKSRRRGHESDLFSFCLFIQKPLSFFGEKGYNEWRYFSTKIICLKARFHICFCEICAFLNRYSKTYQEEVSSWAKRRHI